MGQSLRVSKNHITNTKKSTISEIQRSNYEEMLDYYFDSTKPSTSQTSTSSNGNIEFSNVDYAVSNTSKLTMDSATTFDINNISQKKLFYQKEVKCSNINNTDKELIKLLSIPIPRNIFNQPIESQIDIGISTLKKKSNYPHIKSLLKHKISQIILLSFYEYAIIPFNDKPLSFSYKAFISIIEKFLSYSKNDLESMLEMDILTFLNTPEAKQYFFVKKCSKTGEIKIIPSCYQDILIEHKNITSNLSSKSKFNKICDLINPSVQVKIYDIEPNIRYLIGKLMIYSTFFYGFPRTKYFLEDLKANISFLSGVKFDKHWYTIMFGKISMQKMWLDIFSNKITITTYEGSSVICVNLTKEMVMDEIEEIIQLYNKFSKRKKLDANVIFTLEKCEKSKNNTLWIPPNKTAQKLFNFNANGFF